MDYDIIIAGGGLAGCAAATLLARRGHHVALVEKGSFPRHKLCGEFLSPEVQDAFQRLGVLDAVRDAGAHAIDRATITSPGGATFACDLPGTAIGLSRFVLDEMLFETAGAAGADTFDRTRVTDIQGSLTDGFTVATDHGDMTGRVVLGAFGKRSTLDRKLDRPFLNDASDLVAFKAHFSGVSVPHTIEIHAFPGGYCGLSHVENDRLNVCWIGHTDGLQDAGGRPETMMQATLRQNPHLDERLSAATRETDFYAVSQVSLEPKAPFERDVCMIGDTAGMIAPLCGDGMAMALDAASLAAPHVEAFLEGDRTAEGFRSGYRQDWSDTFSLRMRVGRLAHAAAMRPAVAATTVGALRLAPALGRWLVRATRG